MAYSINIQNYTVGNVGQYIATSINVNIKPFEISDTTVYMECWLITSTGEQIPEQWGKFTVPVAWAMNQTRVQLQSAALTAILAFPNPDFVQR